jgi:hypothetical protein
VRIQTSRTWPAARASSVVAAFQKMLFELAEGELDCRDRGADDVGRNAALNKK